jgi:hypothetical protein
MRKVLIKLAIYLGCLVIAFLIWVFAGRQISIWIDDLGTTKVVKSFVVSSLSYDGTERGGTFRIGDLTLSTSAPNQQPFPITIQNDAQGRLILTKDEKSFPLGEPRSANNSSAREFVPDAGDDATLATRRSSVPWPTPFDLNFMTGQSPSWKRHLYYQLRWVKPDGTKLRMIWRFEQYFYRGTGWANGFMTHEGTTGLIRVSIQP